DHRVVGRPLDAIVPGVVVMLTIAVRLPVRLVVLAGIGDDIGEGETVMRGDEVDGAGAFSGEDLRGARHRRGEGTEGVAAALPEPADGDPVAVVPFEEGRGE